MPRQRHFTGLWLFVFACALFMRPAVSSAENPRNVDASAFGQRVALGPEWLFSSGDNSDWVSPGLDDSSWTIVSSQRELTDYGFRNIRHAWYRLHIHLRPGTPPFIVALEGIAGSYEIYVNGQKIGGNGTIAGQPFHFQSALLGFPVPQGALAPTGDLILAIRFAVNASGSRGAGTSTPIYSSSGVYLLSPDAFQRDASYDASHRAGPRLVLVAVCLLVSIVALALFIAMRSRREYLAASAYLLFSTGLYSLDALRLLTNSTPSADWIRFTFFGLSNAAVIEFIRLVLGQRRTRWILGLEAAIFISGFWSPLSNYGLSTFYVGFVGFFAPIFAVNVTLIVLLFRGLRAGNVEARVLLPAVVLDAFCRYWNFLRYLAYYLDVTDRLRPLGSIRIGSYEPDIYLVSDFIFLIAILLFLVLRTVGIARHNAEVKAELEAARTVQQILIPEEIPSIPGLALDCVYKPAGQVGGDFFQILPTPNNGALIVIGDVSGKGMPAAMAVSLLVGTVRTLAHYTQSPGEILTAMNQRMLGRSSGGFTTCLVLRCDADGKLTIANAGHIAPYVAGKELPLENGLPLGLAADTTYAERSFHLAPGHQLTLLTDGVVESRDQDGALLGFERSAALSIQPAKAIACAAQEFGQDDDIPF